MNRLSVSQRLDRRWLAEGEALKELAACSQGRLQVLSLTESSVKLRLDSVSAFRLGDGEPEIARAWHRIGVYRPAEWPARPVRVVHEGPPGLFHPNVSISARGPLSSEPMVAHQQLAGFFRPGSICYGLPASNMDLSSIAIHIAHMLGYRWNAFSKEGPHYNLEAVRWVQDMLQQPGVFPLERRPLVTGGQEASGVRAR